MAEKNLCPTCHSLIATGASSTGETRKKQGEEEAGNTVEITGAGGKTRDVRTSTSEAIPQWTDDPLITLDGFNGDAFKDAQDKTRLVQIREIQDARIAEEEEIGFTNEEKTDFTAIELGDELIVRHIIELRESTEKILNVAGRTLKEYFELDIDEEVVESGPRDKKDKDEWSDVERGKEYVLEDGTKKKKFTLPDGEEVDSPSVPASTKYRAVQLEDLRHPLHLGWREFWSVSDIQSVEIPVKFTAKETTDQQFIRNVPASNFPTLFPGGNTNREDHAIRAIPEPFGSRVIESIFDGTGVGPQNIFIEITATDQGKKGFPSDFDIRGSDGGNKYLFNFVDIDNAEPAYGTKTTDQETGKVTYDLERAWILEGENRKDTGSLVGSTLVQGGTAPDDNFLCPFEHEISGSASSNSSSTSKAEIVDAADELVKRGNKNAKTLRLSVNAKTEHTASGAGVLIAPRSESWIRISHIWRYKQDLDKNFGYPISLLTELPNPGDFDPFTSAKQDDLNGDQGNRDLFVTNKTHFKFFADYVRAGDTDLYGHPTEGPSDVQFYIDRAFEDEQGQLDINDPVNETFGVLNFGGFFQFPNFRVGITPNSGTSHDDAEKATRLNFTVGMFLLVLNIGDPVAPHFFKFYLSDPFPGTEDEIETKSGKFNGQSFDFIKPPIGNNKTVASVFLGDGNNGKYDQIINIDDLLVAWSDVPSSGFGYTSHKSQENGDIVENPNGTKVQFVWTTFYLGAMVIPRVINGQIVRDGASSPTCGAPSVNGAIVDNFTADATLELSALRIENNDKKLEDLPTNA